MTIHGSAFKLYGVKVLLAVLISAGLLIILDFIADTFGANVFVKLIFAFIMETALSVYVIRTLRSMIKWFKLVNKLSNFNVDYILRSNQGFYAVGDDCKVCLHEIEHVYNYNVEHMDVNFETSTALIPYSMSIEEI